MATKPTKKETQKTSQKQDPTWLYVGLLLLAVIVVFLVMQAKKSMSPYSVTPTETKMVATPKDDANALSDDLKDLEKDPAAKELEELNTLSE